MLPRSSLQYTLDQAVMYVAYLQLGASMAVQ
jgi:hypothetical protein